MLPLKIAIFGELRTITNIVETLSDEKINELMFHHSESLRLTYAGFLWMNKMFTGYQFPVSDTLKAKHQIGLSRMEYPYYITPSRLVLFSDTDAMVVKLSGGIERFLETSFQIDRD